MERKINHEEKYWEFTKEVLLEIKKQENKSLKLRDSIKNDSIQYNVYLLLDKQNPIPIEELGNY